jgi:ATP-dependent RNA helicase DDX10/DBP4
LDLGFKAQLDGILSYLPPRQTLLFSATQTKSVKDLARLSLNSPEYLAVHSEEEDATPKSLIQNYIITDIEEKLDTLFSFVKTHLKSKIIVFFSTCSQVRFAFECFRSMQPGITLCALHGKIKQERRTLIYMDFVRRPCSCLFATDIAARGLDFPNVDWVLQFDAPEDPAAYIHRVGRTARYNAGGRALMMLLPTEEHAVVNSLTSAGVPIKKLTMNKKHAVSVSLKASALLVSRPECRELAKKAFCGYLKALQLLPDRERNNISGLNVDSYAKSLGLAITPQVPLIANGGTEGREVLRESKNVNRKLDKLKTSIKEAKEERKRLREGQAPKAVEKKVPIDAEGGEEELFSVKRVHEWAKEAAAGDLETMEVVSNNKKAKLLKIGIDGKAKIKSSVGPKKIIFNDDDEVVEPFRFEAPVTAGVVDRLRIEGHLERIRQRVDDGREEDLERERERIRLKHREQRQATKGPRADEDEGPQAMLCTAQDDESEYENDAESNDHDSNNKDDDSDAIEDDATDEDGEEDVESLKQREIVAMRMLHSKQRR